MSDTIGYSATAPARTRVRVGIYAELTKPRITALVLVATAAGFGLGLQVDSTWAALPALLHTIVGTALVAAGANALNQCREVEFDRLMRRTQSRPLPSGRMSVNEALGFGGAAGALGMIYLTTQVNVSAALLAGMTLATYVFVYTPLKRATSTCVLVGAVSGALPPVIGWAAAGPLSIGAWLLFAILFFWQLPHFAAIAWLHRDDYARAGYPMLPVIDPGGMRTDLHMMTHTAALLIASALPVVYGLSGMAYAIGAMLLGLAFLGFSVHFVLRKSVESARWHLFASVIYLPLLLSLMLMDKLSLS